MQRSFLLVVDNAAVTYASLDLHLWLSVSVKCLVKYSVGEASIPHIAFPAHLERSDPKGISFSSADTPVMLFAVLPPVAKDKAAKFGSSSQFDPKIMASKQPRQEQTAQSKQ